jgi:hypothetical protein
VVSYIDILTGKVTAGKRVAVIGAGGIGFDIADFLTHDFTGHGGGPNFSNLQNDKDSILKPQVDKVRENCTLFILFFKTCSRTPLTVF